MPPGYGKSPSPAKGIKVIRKKRSPSSRGAQRKRATLHFRMASRRSAIGPTVERILKAVGTSLSADRREDLAVALAEALSNAAVHGNHLQAHITVRITLHTMPDRLTVDVGDSGSGFDESSLSDPTQPSRVLVPAGRGVFLMRRLVDRLEYNAPGNIVRLTMKRHPTGT